jgi:cytochrome P450
MRNLTAEPAAPVPVDDIDLFDPRRFELGTQQPAWHVLRERHPVWVQTGPGGQRFWSITRYHDVLKVIKDHRTYSSEHGTILAVLGGDSAGGKTINLMDQPKHHAVRVPTMPLLAGRAMARRAEAIRAEVRKLVGDMVDAGECDFARLVLPIALIAVGEVVGVPRGFWADVPGWAMAGVAPADPVFATGNVEETLQAAHYELFAMFHELIRDRRRRPQDDVVTALLGVSSTAVRCRRTRCC